MKAATVIAATFLLLGRSLPAQNTVPHHEANFDAERQEANRLYLNDDKLKALPLYEDLCRQDSTIAVFAERHASGLTAAAAIEDDPAKRQALDDRAMAEFRRAQKLGDDSDLVRTMLGMDEDFKRASKAAKSQPAGTPADADVNPLISKNPEVARLMNEGEIAFAKNDIAAAKAAYEKASELDPTFYMAKLYTGDACFRGKDYACAGEWFAKAVALDPNRETAYRYWGDALFRSGHQAEAKAKYEQAVIAEPYVRLSWGGLTQWANATKTQMGSPQIVRPAIKSGQGSKIELPQGPPADLAAWTVYAGCRADADRVRPSGSRRTVAEEFHCLKLAADTAASEVSSGGTKEDALSPGVRALLALQRDNMLECWLLLNGADQEILHDYPEFRETHRDLLLAYLDKYVIHQDAGPATERPKVQIQNPN